MKKSVKIFLVIMLAIIVILLILFAILMLTEYKPKDVEQLNVEGNATKVLNLEEKVKILTYNIGYLSLDKTQDFFLDGGTSVRPKTNENVLKNLDGVNEIIASQNPDICLLQEVD